MNEHLKPNPATSSALAGPPLLIRSVDAIPVALPLKKPVKMAGVAIAYAREPAGAHRGRRRHGRLGRGGLGADHDRRHAGRPGGGRARPPGAAADRPGRLDAAAAACARCARALMGNTGAHSAIEMALLDLAGRAAGVPLVDLIGGARAHRRCAHVAARQSDGRGGHRRGARQERRGLPFLQAQGRHQAARRRRSPPRTPCAQALGPDMPLCADANCGLDACGGAPLCRGDARCRPAVLEQPLAPADLAGLGDAGASCRRCRSASTRASIRSPTSRRMRAPAPAACRSS